MSRQKLGLALAQDLESFFEQEVSATAHKQGLEVTPLTVDYLARILSRFSDSQKYLVSDPNTQKKSMPVLAQMYAQTLTQNPSDQFFQFQHLGDVALFTAGFFGERIEKSLVDMDYYCAMGGMAYERAGHLRESLAHESKLNVYFELAEHFGGFVEVLGEISDQKLLSNDQDMLRLYEKWLKTKSFRLFRMLAENGVISQGNTE
jgi:hypothetical protein